MLTEEQQKIISRLAIRKLHPAECFILMGATYDDYQKCKDMGVSDSQLYKQAGNGLISNCVQYIMEHMYKILGNNDYETTDERMIRDGYGI